MKAIHLLSIVLMAAVHSYGQNITNLPGQILFDQEYYGPVHPLSANTKSQGEVFYRETLNWEDSSDPKGWKLPEGWQIADLNDLGHNWVWRAGTDSIRGNYTWLPGHIYSKSPDDGYFVLPMDEYNSPDGINTYDDANVWFQLPSMDFSARPGVFLKLSQDFRFCCNSISDIVCLVSTDRGERWAIIDMKFKTGGNVLCKNPYPEINISEIAAGMPEVWIRFVWKGNSRYFWCIDDLELSEAFQNEIKLDEIWISMTDLTPSDDDNGFFFMLPYSQTGEDLFGSYCFKALLKNEGLFDQEGCLLQAEVYKNKDLYYKHTSPMVDIWSFMQDTLEVTDKLIPDDYGDYKIVLTAIQDNTDDNPSNNSFTDTFHITDSIYSMTDWDWENWSSTNYAGGNNDGDYLGIVYDISRHCEANSISCMIIRRKDGRVSTEPGHDFRYTIFKWIDQEQDWIEIISSDLTTVTEEMINAWVAIPLVKDGESEFLEPGQYIAAIQTFHNHGYNADLMTARFTIGHDMSHSFNEGRSVCFLVGYEQWFKTGRANMIRLNLNEKGAPATTDVVFNIDMSLPISTGYFSPDSDDYVDIAGSFNSWTGSQAMDDIDGDGIYSLTIPHIRTFQKIEYTYRINGDWETSEFPRGEPARIYRTSYHNELNDVYKNGIILDTDISTLKNSVHLYPNPTKGLFCIEIVCPVSTELDITVKGLQGSTIFSKNVGHVTSHRETIDLSYIPKGLYLVEVNNKVFKLVLD